MRQKIKLYLQNLLPSTWWDYLNDAYLRFSQIEYRQRRYAINRLKKKQSPINVLFFISEASNWKYDSLYQMMLQDSNFNPSILICTEELRGDERKLERLLLTRKYFANKGYTYFNSYDENSKTYIDVRSMEPDIIFYSSPYRYYIDERFYISQFKDVLTCYVNYFYVSVKDDWTCALDFHKALWRYYVENEILVKQIKLYSPINYKNCRVVGYPLFDTIRKYHVSAKDWPISGVQKKRIIWAPHHTIEEDDGGYCSFSTFLYYYDYMLDVAERYKDKIQIVFKPHPLLKNGLYNHPLWGKERTEAYYEKWAKGGNTAFADGEYVGLFLASDAMIHDCNSFTVEYLAVHKPVMFLDRGATDDRVNQIAVDARECHYLGYKQEDIERFIQKVVLGGEDDLKERREAFYNKYILPPNGKLAAENIIDDLLISLGRK